MSALGDLVAMPPVDSAAGLGTAMEGLEPVEAIIGVKLATLLGMHMVGAIQMEEEEIMQITIPWTIWTSKMGHRSELAESVQGENKHSSFSPCLIKMGLDEQQWWRPCSGTACHNFQHAPANLKKCLGWPDTG